MAGLPEANDYPAEIYQIETSDPVIGGYPNEATGAGMANIPHAQLAKRTHWLKARVDGLLAQVVAASTTVAGIVRLSTSTNSSSTTMAATPSAVKAVNDALAQRALSTRSITGAGLATGGGDLSANRTITVPISSQEEALAGTDNATAMTPLRVAQAMAKQVTIEDWDAAGTNGVVYKGYEAANAPPGGGWYIGTVIAYSDAWITQTVFPFNSDSPADTRVYRRERNSAGSPAAWGPWYRLRISQDEQATLWAPNTRTITGAGLATGGGDLSANRTITVPIATQAQAEAGTDNATAMTPLRAAQSAAAALAAGVIQAGSAILTAISNLSATGLIVRTAAGVVAARTLTAGAGITVTNGNGVSGNPTVALTIATQAEAEAGAIDTKGMTPLKVKQALAALIGGVATAAGFAVSTGVNGYIRLPSWLGGIVIQWLAVEAPTGTTTAYTLPIAFPTAARACVATVGTTIGASQYATGSSVSTTSVSLRVGGSTGTSQGHNIIAIGY